MSLTGADATAWPTLPDGRMLVLRTCRPDMTSHRDRTYRWPGVGGIAVAPDWDPDPTRACGGGLHGLLWGCGDGGLLRVGTGFRWLVVAVDPADIADVDAVDKVRFRSGEVLVVGDRSEAVGYIQSLAPHLPVAYGTSIAGYYGTATAGYYGTSTAGRHGTSIAGDYGTSIAGDYGTATAGYYGTATAGRHGTSTAGDRGTVVVAWWDGVAGRRRITVGYVGEDGIEAGVAYRCDETGTLVQA